MDEIQSKADIFWRDMRVLVEAWCDRRCLYPLSIVLPAYVSFNGLTDGWGELLSALKRIDLSNASLTVDECETIQRQIRLCNAAVRRMAIE